MLPRSSTSRSYFEVKPIQSQQVSIARRMRQSRVYPGGWQPTSAAHIIYNRWCHAYFRLTEQDEKKIMIIKFELKLAKMAQMRPNECCHAALCQLNGASQQWVRRNGRLCDNSGGHLNFRLHPCPRNFRFDAKIPVAIDPSSGETCPYDSSRWISNIQCPARFETDGTIVIFSIFLPLLLLLQLPQAIILFILLACADTKLPIIMMG